MSNLLNPREHAQHVCFQYIKLKRIALHISLEQLSELSGIDEANLSRIENGKSIPRLDTFLSLSTILELYNLE